MPEWARQVIVGLLFLSWVSDGLMSERKVQRQHVAAGNASGRFIVDEPGGRDALLSAFTQSYNPARRRSELAFTPAEEGTGAGRTYGFTYRGDGALTKVTAGGFANFFTYGMDGLLKTKSNALVTHGITTRDGVGRVTASTVDAGGSTILEEAFSWAVDGRMQATTALRSGTSSEGVQRNFSYNARGQLVAEDSNFLSATDWNYVYRFDRETSPDGLGLGIRTLSQRRLTSSMPTDLEPGSWLAKNAASPSSNPLDVFGRPVKEGPVVGTVNTYQERASAYDAAGNQTTRGLAGGKTQTLTWDAFGRPVQVSERDGSNDGFDFTAVYDGLGRRFRTSERAVASGSPTGDTKIVDSYFDPSVEFLELGVAVNGERVWKVYGPDLSGAYGGSQGMGGLLATIEESDGTTVAVANDQMGNALARVSGSSVMWNDADLTAYGVGPASTVPALEEASDLAETLVWRGTRQDPTGLVWMGERYYDPASGRFLSTDPLGHGASMSLYDYASGDPINYIDPDGRFGKAVNYSSRSTIGPSYTTVDSFDLPQSHRSQLSQALNYVPVIGQVKAGLELVGGYDFVGGRHLETSERIGSAVSLGVGALPMGSIGGSIGRGAVNGIVRAESRTVVSAITRNEVRVAANSTLSAGRRVGWATPIPKYDVNAPWWKPVTPRFGVDAGVVTDGRTAAQIFATKVHEGQHIKDIINHPQMTYLATQKGFFPGAGAARYWMEYRGYSAAGQMQNLATPLRSFNQTQKINLGMDIGIFGVGGAAAGYSVYGYLND